MTTTPTTPLAALYHATHGPENYRPTPEAILAAMEKLGWTVARVGEVQPGTSHDQSAAVTPEPAPTDSRDPDYTREGIFIYHNCWKCDDGKKPCPYAPNHCEYPHARND